VLEDFDNKSHDGIDSNTRKKMKEDLIRKLADEI